MSVLRYTRPFYTKKPKHCLIFDKTVLGKKDKLYKGVPHMFKYLHEQEQHPIILLSSVHDVENTMKVFGRMAKWLDYVDIGNGRNNQKQLKNVFDSLKIGYIDHEAKVFSDDPLRIINAYELGMRYVWCPMGIKRIDIIKNLGEELA